MLTLVPKVETRVQVEKFRGSRWLSIISLYSICLPLVANAGMTETPAVNQRYEIKNQHGEMIKIVNALL